MLHGPALPLILSKIASSGVLCHLQQSQSFIARITFINGILAALRHANIQHLPDDLWLVTGLNSSVLWVKTWLVVSRVFRVKQLMEGRAGLVTTKQFHFLILFTNGGGVRSVNKAILKCIKCANCCLGGQLTTPVERVVFCHDVLRQAVLGIGLERCPETFDHIASQGWNRQILLQIKPNIDAPFFDISESISFLGIQSSFFESFLCEQKKIQYRLESNSKMVTIQIFNETKQN